jgi:hypothetical protein
MGKVPTTTEASEKMSLSENIRRKKYPQAIANWPVEERPREKLLFKTNQISLGVESITEPGVENKWLFETI